jgi:hypothetical protein
VLIGGAKGGRRESGFGGFWFIRAFELSYGTALS